MCSVLFCDLVGFTPLSESRDPEAVRELLSQYFAASRTIIERYGGVVEKFIGDAVMAVWGAPVAAEGDAERAVRAGLDVVAAVAELGERAGVAGLAARAGVVTGEVAITVGAVHEGMVAGDTVNTAARVQTAAAPGQVLADEATVRLAGGGVGFAEAGSHALKGKAEPVRLWRATRVLAGVGGAQRVDGLEAPLTGRDAELRAVRELFHAAAERRVPRLVLVSGPAGVGKSRLGWEFEKYADGLAEQVWWHRGRCPAYGQGVAFWALAEIVRQRLSIAEDDQQETAAAKLAAGLEEFIPGEPERAYVGVRLSRLLGVGAADDGEPLSGEELFAGWRLFFERLAASGPVVLLVEDAQYADSGLLDFLEHLIDWVRELPVFVLVFARPELSHARPGFGTGRNRSTLTLDPLDPASMDLLVQELVPGMPARARAAVTAHAEGLPLFAVETIRSLIDRDIVQPVEGAYRLVGEIGELVVPESLHALLAARLDALEPAVRRLVTDAALLGDAFTADALAAVSGQHEASVRAALGQLLRREVLSVSADPLSPQRGSYQFTHHLLRQVAYDTLSRRDRKARHLAVAAYLREAFPGDGEEVADVIARHYLDALNAVPGAADTTEVHDQAVTMLIRAAERAERTGAPARAAASYVTAAELTAPTSGSAGGEALASAGRLWERAAQAALTGGEWAVAVGHAGRARELHLQRADNRAAARAQAIAGRALRLWGRHAQAREQLTAALQVLRPDPDADTVRALDELAMLEVFAGSPDSDALSTEALVLAQALGAGPGQLADIFVSRGIYLYLAQRRTEGIAYLTQAARLAEQADSHTLLGRVHINLAETFVTTSPASAAEAARTAAGHLRRTGALDYLGMAVINLAQAQLALGDWDSAEQQLTQAMEADGLAGNDYLAIYLGWLAALRGDAESPAAMLAGLRDLRSSEDSQDMVFVAVVDAFAAAARGEPQDALRHARASLAHSGPLGIGFGITSWAWPLAARLAHELGDAATVGELLAELDAHSPGHVPPRLRAERDLVRARLAAADGDPAADQALAAAVAGLRAHGTPYHLAYALLDHAQHLLGLGDTGAAEAAISEARVIAGRLRCQPLLDRAEATSKPVAARTSA
ncbi:MAG TPA: adenylate/guanylate cyclase domain-containing protein [Streptosporangiaceae bacterium]|nr:adenylate/guanylate cyclase domain-containing protein [Streptosporangiaceae bacterium]